MALATGRNEIKSPPGKPGHSQARAVRRQRVLRLAQLAARPPTEGAPRGQATKVRDGRAGWCTWKQNKLNERARKSSCQWGARFRRGQKMDWR